MTSLERKIHLFPEAVVLGSKPREYEVLRTPGIRVINPDSLLGRELSCMVCTFLV